MNEEYYTPDECLDLRSEGYPQGRCKFLWHKNKHNKDRWELYKRNSYDISSFGDRWGYNRWVSAVRKTDDLAKDMLAEANDESEGER